MVKNMIFLLILAIGLLATSVLGEPQHIFSYNPYTSNLDMTLDLNQSGNNFTIDFINVNGSLISDVCFSNGTKCDEVNSFISGSNTSLKDYINTQLFVNATNNYNTSQFENQAGNFGLNMTQIFFFR